MTAPKKPKKTRTQLVKLADKHFSLAIRLRDSSNGVGECITCNKKLHYKEAHAGHFQKRRYYATRWDEENVNLQCSACNTFGDGEQFKYARALKLKYGDEVPEKLEIMARGGVGKKFPSSEIEQIIQDSKELIKFYESKSVVE